MQARAFLILRFVTLRPGAGQSVPGHIPGTTWAAPVFIEVSVSRRHGSMADQLTAARIPDPDEQAMTLPSELPRRSPRT